MARILHVKRYKTRNHEKGEAMVKLYFLILLSLLSCDQVVFGSQTGERERDPETGEIFLLPMKRQKLRKAKPSLSAQASQGKSRLSSEALEWEPELSTQGANPPECSSYLLWYKIYLGETI